MSRQTAAIARPGRLLLTLGLLGVAAMAIPGMAAAQDGATLEVKLSKTDIDLGTSTVLSGELKGVSSPADERVSVFAREFPYKKSRKVASTTTGTGGSFNFRLKPTLNTKYRVVSGTATSRQLRAYVYVVKVETNLRTLRTNRAAASFFSQFPANYPLRLEGRRVTWYFRKTTNPIFRTIATSQTRVSDTKRVMSSVRFDLPDSRQTYRYVVSWCFQLGKPNQDIGVGRKAGGRCPRRYRDEDARRAASPIPSPRAPR